jgi:hypothetical protein
MKQKLLVHNNMKTILKKSFAVMIALTLGSHFAIAQTQKGADIQGEAAWDWSGSCVSMPDANTIAIGAPFNDESFSYAGHVRVFSWNGTAWVQKGADINGEAAEDISGRSVSMPDANTIAIGASFNDDGADSNAGHVRVFSWNGTAWVQKGADIDGEAAYNYSGSSVSMPDANTVAIGAPYNDDPRGFAGNARVFNWNGMAWVQKGADIDGEGTSDLQGLSVSVSMPDENTVAIGAPENNGAGSNAGHVRIFTWNGTAWLQKGADIDGEAAEDYSGGSVSMPDANTIAIGAPENDGAGDNAGHVRIYTWNGTAWVQKGADIDGKVAGDEFGSSVSMPNANTIAIGAPSKYGTGTSAGHVRIFSWNGTAWIKKGTDIDGDAAEDYFGVSVSMPDSITVGIGANANDGNGDNSGLTRVYDLSTTVGILENTFGKNVVVYPNPTKCELNIDLGSSQNDLVVVIKNVIGQELVRKTYHATSSIQCEIPGEAGIYFVEVSSLDNKVVLKVQKK